MVQINSGRAHTLVRPYNSLSPIPWPLFLILIFDLVQAGVAVAAASRFFIALLMAADAADNAAIAMKGRFNIACLLAFFKPRIGAETLHRGLNIIIFRVADTAFLHFFFQTGG